MTVRDGDLGILQQERKRGGVEDCTSGSNRADCSTTGVGPRSSPRPGADMTLA